MHLTYFLLLKQMQTTRNTRFFCGTTCGFMWIFRRKRFSYGFCQEFSFPCNSFVGNCFLRILGSAGNSSPQEEWKNPQETLCQWLGNFPAHKSTVSANIFSGISAVNEAGKFPCRLFFHRKVSYLFKKIK